MSTQQTEKEKLKEALYSLDWIKILAEAIAMRPTSWSKDPVWQWRNASDTVLWSLIKALEEKGLLETRVEMIERFKSTSLTPEKEKS